MSLRFVFCLGLTGILAGFGSFSAEPLRAKPGQSILESVGKTPEAERLKQLFGAYWKYSMEEAPEVGTYVGYAGLNDRWSDLSLSAIQRRKEDIHLWLRALESIDRAKLGLGDRLNYDLFRKEILLEIEGQKFPAELMPINQMGGVQQDVAQTISVMPLEKEKDYRDVLERIRTAPKLIEQNIALLRLGAAQRVTPPRTILRDVPEQIQNQIIDDLPRNPVYAPFTNIPPNLPATLRTSLTNEAAGAVREHLLPAWRKLNDFFSTEYLPHTRESIGAADLPNGKAWYAFNARRYTTTDLSPAQIHQIGLSEVTRIRAEMDLV